MDEQSQLSLQDAADILGWSIVHLRRLIRAGELRVGSTGNMVLWEDVRSLVGKSLRLASLATDDDINGSYPPVWTNNDEVNAGRAGEFGINRIVQGNCLESMRRMPSGIVQAVITSPPYWGVRVYADEQNVTWGDGTRVAFGQEKWPEEYVRHTLEILRELRRVVRDDGVVWWNVGDTYMTRSHVRTGSGERLDALEGRRRNESWKDYPVRRYSAGHPYLKDKDLTLIPFQIALGAQRLGWWVRSVITWAKANTMPEPVKDRPTTSHEYILMLTKSRFYKYDIDAASEEAVSDWVLPDVSNGRRNWRTVWNFGTSVGHGNHVAAFPIELPLRCIAASTEPGDLVFDPFVGSGTTMVAADQLGRYYYGCDISPTYVAEAVERIEARKTKVTSNGHRPRGKPTRGDAAREIQGQLLEASERQYDSNGVHLDLK